jgi:hypothetical protein
MIFFKVLTQKRTAGSFIDELLCILFGLFIHYLISLVLCVDYALISNVIHGQFIFMYN